MNQYGPQFTIKTTILNILAFAVIMMKMRTTVNLKEITKKNRRKKTSKNYVEKREEIIIIFRLLY